MRIRCGLLTLILLTAWPLASRAADKTKKFEVVLKSSVAVHNLKGILRPFVATCEREKDYFRKLFCNALNERLKAQHQSKVYLTTVEPSETGPLQVKFKARPKPSLEITIRGCLTCKEPVLARAGGDISKGRFFVFKMPKSIRIKRGKVLYDLGDINVARYQAELPKGTKEETFKKDILPHIRLQFVYKPVAGVTRVGGRFKYGVINFQLVAHRVYDKCAGKVFGTTPPMTTKFKVDKNDLSCPQNRPKKTVVKPKLPSTLPQAKVKALMELVASDLKVCYEMFGQAGDVPTDLVVSTVGKVKYVRVTGKLANTPTGQCVERLIKTVKFPKFSGKDARLQWPFSLK